MLIEIWQDDTQPLSGHVVRDAQELRRFAGWLQLLSILSEWLDPERMPSPSDRDGDR